LAIYADTVMKQRDIILSFAELLRIAPVKMQFKSNANRADVSKFLAKTIKEMEREENHKCRYWRNCTAVLRFRMTKDANPLDLRPCFFLVPVTCVLKPHHLSRYCPKAMW